MADKTFKRERNRPAERSISVDGAIDAAPRRRALVIVVAGLVLGGAIIALTDSYRRDLTGWAQNDPIRALNLILPAMAVTIGLPVLALAWYFWRLGARTVREQRFPPSHVSWARGAQPVFGASARRRGRLLQGCAAALVAIIVVFSAILTRLVMNLKGTLDSGGAV